MSVRDDDCHLGQPCGRGIAVRTILTSRERLALARDRAARIREIRHAMERLRRFP